jgi:hypothetical protein
MAWCPGSVQNIEPQGLTDKILRNKDLADLLPRPLLALYDRFSQAVDSRLVTLAPGFEPVHHFGIDASRNEILRLRGRFQRAFVPVSSTGSDNRSSSSDACSQARVAGRDRAFRRFVF